MGNNAAVMLHIGIPWLCGYKLAHPFSSGSSCLGVITHTHIYMLSSHWFSVGCFYIIIIFCVLHQELRSCVVETHPRRLVRWDGWQFFFSFLSSDVFWRRIPIICTCVCLLKKWSVLLFCLLLLSYFVFRFVFKLYLAHLYIYIYILKINFFFFWWVFNTSEAVIPSLLASV